MNEKFVVTGAKECENSIQAMMRDAIGGVFFLDEAYNMKTKPATTDQLNNAISAKGFSPDGEGQQEADGQIVNTLVILAGYHDRMTDWLAHANPGLDDRIKERIVVKPNTAGELMVIADRWLKENKYSLADLETSAALQGVICNTPGMNARVVVDDLLPDINTAYSTRMFAQEEDDAVLTKEDVLKGVHISRETARPVSRPPAAAKAAAAAARRPAAAVGRRGGQQQQGGARRPASAVAARRPAAAVAARQ